MTRHILWPALFCLGLLPAVQSVRSEEPRPALKPFEFVDGDRVALLGATFLNRERNFGYLEAALTSRFPDRSVTFLNTNATDDKVSSRIGSHFGESVTQLDAFKPTVVLIVYEPLGHRERVIRSSVSGVNRLVDFLVKRYHARVVIVMPPPYEKLGDPHHDVQEANTELARHGRAIREMTTARGWYLIEPFDDFGRGEAKRDFPLTDDGVHLTAFGYWQAAPLTLKALGLQTPEWLIDVDAAQGPSRASSNPRVSDFVTGPSRVSFKAVDAYLPQPLVPLPTDSPDFRAADKLTAMRMTCFHNLPEGSWTLTIDGEKYATAASEHWETGQTQRKGPDIEQAEHLRTAIVKKNELLAKRWGAAEQAAGAGKRDDARTPAELAELDRLVAEQEKIIADLRVPKTHRYELTRD